MSNYDYEPELTKQDIRLREKQAKCPHCSFKCSLCGLYQDNVKSALKRQIEALEGTLEVYDKLLTENHIVHISYCECNQDVIINLDSEELNESLSV